MHDTVSSSRVAQQLLCRCTLRIPQEWKTKYIVTTWGVAHSSHWTCHARIPGTRSHRLLNFVWWCLVFVGPQYRICFMSLIYTQSSGMAFWKVLHPYSELSSLSNTIPEHIHSVVRSWHEPTDPVAVEVWLLTFYQDTATKVPYFNTSRNAVWASEGTLRRSPIPQY
jgi:hypothetical protein